MDTVYAEKFFINPAIEYGIASYKKEKNGEKYNRAHTFELYVIKALVAIYGEKTILLPYKIDNPKAFECNLLMYDLREVDMKRFIKYMNDYHEFIKTFKSNEKASGLITEIEKLLLEMIIKRSKRKPFTEEEIKAFDNIFNPIEGDLKRIKNLIGTRDGLINKVWQQNKYELTNTQMKLMAINPKLLLPGEYAKFGYDLKYVATLSEDEIDAINKRIIEEMIRQEATSIIPITKKSRRIIFSSGNGFVDKLLLLSIMATEIMIGIVIAVNIGG